MGPLSRVETMTPALPGASGKAALDGCLAALEAGAGGCLGVVLSVRGHAYAGVGTLMYVSAAGERCGWISPGCLEATLHEAAARVQAAGHAELLELDNRDLSDIFSGSGAGCRGRQSVLMLPLSALPGIAAPLAAHRRLGPALHIAFDAEGTLRLQAGTALGEWRLPLVREASQDEVIERRWELCLAPLPRVLVCGGGPESALLLELLDQLGWRVDLVESRPAWSALGARAERHLPALPLGDDGQVYDAVLVMAHHFGQDREALLALAGWPKLPLVGLLGPRQRQQDLLATLPAPTRERLNERLESPAGLYLGGRGPAAIALSLAARLQSLLAEPRA